SGQGDPTTANPMRHQLLNLHVALHSFIENRMTVSLLVLLACAALASLFFRFWIWNFEERRNDLLLAFSMVSVLTLMVVYHRFYDGVLLLFPLAWAIGAVAKRGRDAVPGWCVLLFLVPFFTNA